MLTNAPNLLAVPGSPTKLRQRWVCWAENCTRPPLPGRMPVGISEVMNMLGLVHGMPEVVACRRYDLAADSEVESVVFAYHGETRHVGAELRRGVGKGVRRRLPRCRSR